jgi:large subunit ribosomal protein L24
MKFKVGDKVIVTGGKDKGKKSTIVRVLPKKERVVVEGANMYVKHQRPIGDRPGSRMTKERPLPTGNVAILNDKDQQDRIGYQVDAKGNKERIFKKTGAVIKYADKSKKK